MQATSQHMRLPSRQVLSGAREVYDLFSLALKKPKEFELFMTATAECHDLKDAMRPKIEAMEGEARRDSEKVRADADTYAAEKKEAVDQAAERVRESTRNEAQATTNRAAEVSDFAGQRLTEAEDAEAKLVGRADALEEAERLMKGREDRLKTAQANLRTDKQEFSNQRRRVDDAYKGAA